MMHSMWFKGGWLVSWVLVVGLVAFAAAAQTNRRTKSSTAPSANYNKKKCVETDYYCILEVIETASEEEIKKQFRKLAKVYHPDKNRDNQEAAEQQFVLISKAYEILSDEKSRRNYDNERRYGGTQPRGSFHSDENVDDIFRQFQSMFGEDFHGHRQGHNGRNFNTRQQQQQQHFFHSQQQQRPNQKVYFTQRGPDGRTYYYEYTTNNHHHHQPFFGDDSDGSWDPFSFFFQHQNGHNRGGKPYVWYYDFIPTSIWARFVFQIFYYMFFLYLMLSIFSCCTGPAARQVGNNDEETESSRRNHVHDTNTEPESTNNNRKTNNAARGSSTTNSKATNRTNLDVIYPLPVISQKEINETRGIIFIVAASKEMELLLRPRRTSFSKDPLLFRRYHLSVNSSVGKNENAQSSKRYEEVKLMERLFGGNWKDKGTPHRLSSSESPANVAEQITTLRWKIAAVAKIGTKYAMFLPSVSTEKKLENLLKQTDVNSTESIEQQIQRETLKLIEDLVGKDIDEWLCRLVQGMEPWLSSPLNNATSD